MLPAPRSSIPSYTWMHAPHLHYYSFQHETHEAKDFKGPTPSYQQTSLKGYLIAKQASTPPFKVSYYRQVSFDHVFHFLNRYRDISIQRKDTGKLHLNSQSLKITVISITNISYYRKPFLNGSIRLAKIISKIYSNMKQILKYCP